MAQQRMQSNMVFGETEGSKEFMRGNSEELVDSKREMTCPAAKDFEKKRERLEFSINWTKI